MPRLMSNHGNFIGSLGNVVRFLGKKGGVAWASIFFLASPATEILHGRAGEVLGIATGDMGIARDGQPQERLYAGHGTARQIYA